MLFILSLTVQDCLVGSCLYSCFPSATSLGHLILPGILVHPPCCSSFLCAYPTLILWCLYRQGGGNLLTFIASGPVQNTLSTSAKCVCFLNSLMGLVPCCYSRSTNDKFVVERNYKPLRIMKSIMENSGSRGRFLTSSDSNPRPRWPPHPLT